MTGSDAISVLGAGAFGTALAVSLARCGTAVTLVARDGKHSEVMQARRENTARLPGVALPDAITVSDKIDTALDGPVLLAVPMQKLRGVLRANPGLDDRPLIACCKGIELDTTLGPSQVIAQERPNAAPLLLTGPSFASDIARGLPTALTLACEDEALGRDLQQQLTTANLRLYRTTDVAGAELGGALKNVMAIACGAAIGAGLGDSARAALMTRGYAEMQRMAIAIGARAETLAGLSGLGDLALTCTSEQSRNYRFGLSIGQGVPRETGMTVEGAATARAVRDRARAMQIDMPISDAVVRLINDEIGVAQAIDLLLARPLKEE
jgi:glycerol-3-phosphate dehydrogenase (NAD(P)+)